MVEVVPVCMLIAVGLAAGLMAGLIGIGGGMVVVPGLFYIFKFMNFPTDEVMHIAVGTAMGVMICTSIASTLSHQVKGDVQWPIFWRIMTGIIIGVIVGAKLDQHLNAHAIEIVFGLFVLAVSIKMFLNWKPKVQGTNKIPNLVLTNGVGLIIGFKSGLLGIGGGALSIPFLIYCDLPMHEVVGTSASFTLPISIVGTLAFLLLGTEHSSLSLSTGYIYWPALLLVAPCTMLGAFLGTKLSHAISAPKLRLIFAIFLFFLGLRMLSS